MNKVERLMSDFPEMSKVQAISKVHLTFKTFGQVYADVSQLEIKIQERR